MAAESIDFFAVDIEAHADATLSVVETIRYDFGTAQRHGIYREIPVEYDTKLGAKQSIAITVEGVTDESQKKYPYSESSSSGKLRIQIGDADTLISGRHTYVIRYRVSYAFGYFDTFDELYWNVTGNEWQVPIRQAEAKVVLPVTVSADRVQTSCYYGVFGSGESCNTTAMFKQNTYEAVTLGELGPGEGLTIAIGFPKGIIKQPTWGEKIWNFFWENPLVLLPVVTFFGMFTLWYRAGRDPKGRGVIIPEYDAPENLSSLEIAGLLHGGISAKYISAGLIELAVRGYLRITKIEKKILIFSTEDYVFTRTDQPAIDEIDQTFLEALFGAPDAFGKTVHLSDLKEKFYKSIPVLGKKIIARLIKKGYFSRDPKIVVGIYLAGGIVVSVVALIVLGGRGISVLLIVISCIIYLIFAALMAKVTKEGALMKERIAGLEEYLRIAEKNRIDFHNAPEKRPEMFEKLLPAAMVLGVEKLWAKEFEGMYTAQPEWYSDTSGAAFSTTHFISGLGDFQTAAASTLGSAPGGSSGSGGGGFSGGGGGGGGGGSW